MTQKELLLEILRNLGDLEFVSEGNELWYQLTDCALFFDVSYLIQNFPFNVWMAISDHGVKVQVSVNYKASEEYLEDSQGTILHAWEDFTIDDLLSSIHLLCSKMLSLEINDTDNED
jgi:hypothetical protein